MPRLAVPVRQWDHRRTMLDRITDLTLGELLIGVIGPMVLLQGLMVAFYIIWTMRIWPRMPRREAMLYAPLAIPLGFVCFFAGLNWMSDSKPLIEFAGILALVGIVTWLPGIVV